MTYSNEELTIRVKQLEQMFLDMQYNLMRLGVNLPICVNASLHGRPGMEEECPIDLTIPHYTWQPQWNWNRDFIALHPRNGTVEKRTSPGPCYGENCDHISHRKDE